MLNFWLFLAVLLIAADWTAVWQGWHRVNYFTKPAVPLLLSIWFWTVSVPVGPALWFGLGLFFSLVGDVFLLFSHRYFMYGWAAFLIAQVAYVIGFNCCLPSVSAFFWFLLGAQIYVWVVVTAVVVKNLSKNPSHRKMVFPVVIYAAAISAMLFSAIWTIFRPDWTALASGLAASGALLFSCSPGTGSFYPPLSPRAPVGARYLSSRAVSTGGRRGSFQLLGRHQSFLSG